MRLISGLCLVLLLAAFTSSAIHLRIIGSQTFGQAVSSSVAMTAVGLATVLSAEVGQVVFSLTLVTLGASKVSSRFLPIYCGSEENAKFLFVGIFVAFHKDTVNIYIRWHHAFTYFHDIGAPARESTALPQVLFMFQFRKGDRCGPAFLGIRLGNGIAQKL